MKRTHPMMAALLAAAARAGPVAFLPTGHRKLMQPRRIRACHLELAQKQQLHTSRSANFRRGAKRRRHHHFSLHSTNASNEVEQLSDNVSSTGYNLSPQIFVDEVISFLDGDGIPWRRISRRELLEVLDEYFERNSESNISTSSEIMAMLEGRVILAVGRGTGSKTNATTSNIVGHEHGDAGTATINKANGDVSCDLPNQQPYSFVLQLCPTTSLDSIQALHRKHRRDSSVSRAVASYAWLNTHLTNAFYNSDSNDPRASNGENDKPLTTIVHLHQDVWNRSLEIVRSRLRSKCGMCSRRIYGRQTIVKRIPKSEYVPFLEENHLWGATGAKYGYGLYLKSRRLKRRNGDANAALQHQDQEEVLVAAATFSSKRKIDRASHRFHSFEMLRFCTKLDTTVVGGLTKLVSAFVKDVKSSQSIDAGIDIVTSIDRDFGSNTWPNFEQMEVMNPLPMFIGHNDGMRRQSVGAGLTPLDQEGGSWDSMTTSMLLRASLPNSLLKQLEHEPPVGASGDWPWQTAAQNGFHPVFDAGVERLMLVVDDIVCDMSPVELWEKSTPRYVTEHYSANAGVKNMLNCIRGA